MLLSEYFLPILKEKPSEASIVSHSLMLRAGMIRMHASGIYHWLPLGLKVLNNVADIVRFNMNAAGCTEMLMPCIQTSDLWKESGRYDTYGQEMLKFKDRHEHELLFGPTGEEMITDMMRHTIQSYRELPKIFYQIQWKFRDEIRPRFGVMRGREFLMKDAYSVDINHEQAMHTYNKMFVAYMNTYSDLGLRVIPVKADTGEIGGSMSHEFHVIAKTGEEKLYYDKQFDLLEAKDLANDIYKVKSLYAATEDMHNPTECPIDQDSLSTCRGIEVGHVFNFGTKYSTPLKAYVNDNTGTQVDLEMGSYGIGISRLVAAIIEVNHDDKGIIWPMSVAPFKAVIVNLNVADRRCNKLARDVYNRLKSHNVDVLYDDTENSAGSKFATNDLIGTPWQVIIGSKKAKDELVELKYRSTGATEDMSCDEVVEDIINSVKRHVR